MRHRGDFCRKKGLNDGFAYVSSHNYTAALAKAIALEYGYWEDGFEQMVELAGNGNVRFSGD